MRSSVVVSVVGSAVLSASASRPLACLEVLRGLYSAYTKGQMRTIVLITILLSNGVDSLSGLIRAVVKNDADVSRLLRRSISLTWGECHRVRRWTLRAFTYTVPSRILLKYPLSSLLPHRSL